MDISYSCRLKVHDFCAIQAIPSTDELVCLCYCMLSGFCLRVRVHCLHRHTQPFPEPVCLKLCWVYYICIVFIIIHTSYYSTMNQLLKIIKCSNFAAKHTFSAKICPHLCTRPTWVFEGSATRGDEEGGAGATEHQMILYYSRIVYVISLNRI